MFWVLLTPVNDRKSRILYNNNLIQSWLSENFLHEIVTEINLEPRLENDESSKGEAGQ